MSILDRYILRQFLKTFAICFISLMGLYVVIECTTNMNEFIRCGEKSGSLLGLISRYYGYRSLLIFNLTCSTLTLTAAMFTVTWLQRHNEMTALMAAGVSRVKIVRSLIFAAFGLIALAAVNRELVIPRYIEQLSRKPQDLLGDRGQSFASCQDNQTDVVIRGKFSYADAKRIEKPDFRLPPFLCQYGEQVTADNAYYIPAQNGRPSGYLFDGVKEPKHLESRSSLLLNGKPVLITPQDSPDWLKPDQCFIVSNLDFNLLTGASNYKQFASVRQLVSSLNNPAIDLGADARVTIHSRIVQPLIDVTLLFLGLPLTVRRESRNMFFTMGLCMAITTAFMLATIGLQSLGGDYYFFPPSLAVWAPIIIFAPAAVWLSHAMWET